MTSKRALLSTVLSLLALASASPATAEPATWTVKDADSRILLFGSVHVLPPELAWRPKALDDALAQADDLWFETDVGGAGVTESGLLARRHGTRPAGAGLLATLSPAGRARLERVCARLGLAPVALDGLRPWLAEVTLSVAALAAQGAGVEAGVERSLLDAAPRAERKMLESPTEQIAFFADAPEADQLASLEDTLRQLDEDPAFYDRLIRAWVAGDLKTIEALGLEPLKTASPVLYQRLIVERNRRWVAAIRKRLAGAGETVIVVGAGHLVGPDGVPALLRAQGIEVEGPQ
ncbi:TraB/GumN family protein [Caulobacter mirabilis]|uniref:TraB/GumN family protein n=1 Tax=Caulobacter mirabilis TaxID=69666 RepID=A0A2D2ASX7_9CAUL|nr:TraB/GumN family protein [Caulobacter mirabilis]ATQ41077.1 TraB/GumN family protein [Caulobacter mirabilis]